MRVLLIEDNLNTGNYLQKGLREEGFLVDVARCGLDGYHLASTEPYHIIVLDVGLPDIDGWAVIRLLRETQKLIPVIFLTARSLVQDKIKGFELGADDYLAKPFDFSELLARIRCLIRRSSNEIIDEKISIQDLMIDIPKRRVFRNGDTIKLTQKEFSILELLARHKGEVLSRTQIASQVWDMNFDSETNVIDVAILRLRSKIDTPYSNKLIQTVRGMGYMLEDHA